MRATVVPGVFSWSVWQPDRNLDFNGFYVATSEGGMVIDPIAPDAATLAEIVERGASAVVITNRDHERAAADVAAATGARIYASALEASLLGIAVDATLEPGDVIHGWTVLGLDGFKTAGEIALHHSALRTVLVGDAIWGAPAGSLTLMPDAKLADPPRAALSARKLRALNLAHLLTGDGACVFGNAHAAIGAMLDARPDAFVTRVNIDELDLRSSPTDPAPFTGADAEVGWLLGAEQMGYRVCRLGNGDVYAPMHWHTREEELFVVLSGAPMVRTPKGDMQLRTGDIVNFAAGPRGAHRMWNAQAEDAVVLLIAAIVGGDVCFYPDSDKLLVEDADIIVRASPELDYFAGELG